MSKLLMLVKTAGHALALAGLIIALAGEQALAEREWPVLPAPASFVMDAAAASDGSLWIASEGDGVWRYQPRDGWRKMDGLPGFPVTPNSYAVAEDDKGRIWVGTDAHGVAVWNGERWQAFGPMEGLAGERVFDIACGRGLVAIATSGGLTLYRDNPEGGKAGEWSRITRSDGLASDQIAGLSIAENGDLYAAFQCGGIGKSEAASGYKTWATDQSPWYWDKNQWQRQPKELFGRGLPSNLCNAVAVAPDGAVWAATCSGLARKSAGSGNWSFLRGADAPAKNKGLFAGSVVPRPKPGAEVSLTGGKPAPPVNNTRKSTAPPIELLANDFVTALYPCEEGIWVGFRMHGAMLLSSRSFRIMKKALGGGDKQNFHWVTSFASLPGGELYAGTYGKGLVALGKTASRALEPRLKGEVAFPPPDAAPTAQQLDAATQALNPSSSQGSAPSVKACFLGEDWATRGDWCGRYGRKMAVLCSANAPEEDIIDTGGPGILNIAGDQGPHHYEGDALRHWVHWVNKPDNRNVLYCPESTTRTEAEWDDQGEVYPMAFDGPDVWAILELPEGAFVTSLYFYNPNGHMKANALRDYLVEVRLCPAKLPHAVLFHNWSCASHNIPPDSKYRNLAAALQSPVLARTRVSHFAGGGVYKTFVLQGPGHYYIRVCRNYSMNTILNGIFVNGLTFDPLPYGTLMFGPKYPNPPDTKTIEVASVPKKPLALWTAARAAFASRQSRLLYRVRPAMWLAYRSLAQEGSARHPLLAVWRWYLRHWLPEDRDGFDKLMRDNWDSKQEAHWPFRSREWSQYGPGTIPFSVREVGEMEKRGINWRQYRSDYPGAPDIPADELKRRLKAGFEKKEQKKPTPEK